MYVLGIDSAVPDHIRAQVVDEMGARAPTGIIERGSSLHEEELPQRNLVRRAKLSADGAWWITGRDGTLEELLDAFAPRCGYAAVNGQTSNRWPRLTYADGAIEATFFPEAIPVSDVDERAIVDAVEATDAWETLESLVTRITGAEGTDRAGAIATFTGRVRARDGPDDTPTERLEFEQYGAIAQDRMNRIRADLCDREGVFEVLLHHRTGVIPAGVDIVFVVVLAGHRQEAFRTVEDGINRLKAEVPIFKKEVTVDEEFWIHSRP